MEKPAHDNNKLIDSLDNMNLLYPSKLNVNMSDKKNKFKQAGSDEHPNPPGNGNIVTPGVATTSTKKSEEKKKIIKNAPSTNYKDKDKKIAIGYAKNSSEKFIVRKETSHPNFASNLQNASSSSNNSANNKSELQNSHTCTKVTQTTTSIYSNYNSNAPSTFSSAYKNNNAKKSKI